MLSKSRRALVTAALAVGAFTISAPAARAQTFGLLQQATVKAEVADTTDATFLTAGMVAQAPPPGGRGPRHGGVGFGIKGGFLFSSFDAANENFKNHNGWLAGIFFGGNRPGVLGVQGEIQYAKKGAEISTTKIDQYYLEIPILLRLNVGTNSLNGVNVYGLVGPVFDINLKTEQNGIDVKDNYESLDLGLLFGGGIEITRFLVEARYNKGLRNVLKEGGFGVTEIKTHSFAVEFGIRFN